MSPTLSEVVTGEIRAELARRRVKQDQLAKAVGRSQATIARRLAGLSAWDLDELEAVAAFFGVPVEALLGLRSPIGATA